MDFQQKFKAALKPPTPLNFPKKIIIFGRNSVYKTEGLLLDSMYVCASYKHIQIQIEFAL